MTFSQLQELKNNTLDFLRSKNFAELTVKSYEYAFDCIVKYAKDLKDFNLSEDVFQPYLKENDFLYQTNKIARYTWLQKRRACRYMASYFEKQSISFSPVYESVISAYYSNMLDAIDGISSHNVTYKQSLRNYSRVFFKWLQSNGHSTFDSVNENVLKEYFLCCTKRMSNRSLSGTRYYIKTLFNFLYENSIIQDNFSNVFNFIIPIERKIQKPVLQSTIAKVLSVIDRNNPIGKRDYAMFVTATVTGLRQIDIVNLKFSNFDWKKGVLNITQSKTQKNISLPLTKDYAEAIVDYILNGRPKVNSEYIFLPELLMYEKVSSVTINRKFRYYCQLCGIESSSFHGVRRMLGSNMAMGGTRIDLIPDILGHSQLESIQPYISVETKGLRQCALSISELPPIEGGLNYV